MAAISPYVSVFTSYSCTVLCCSCTVSFCISLCQATEACEIWSFIKCRGKKLDGAGETKQIVRENWEQLAKNQVFLAFNFQLQKTFSHITVNPVDMGSQRTMLKGCTAEPGLRSWDQKVTRYCGDNLRTG